MKIEIYCASRSMWFNIYMFLLGLHTYWSFDRAEELKNLEKKTYKFLKDTDEGEHIVITCYDRIIPFESRAQKVFLEKCCPQSVRAALKVTNSYAVPFVFNNFEEFKEMWENMRSRYGF